MCSYIIFYVLPISHCGAKSHREGYPSLFDHSLPASHPPIGIPGLIRFHSESIWGPLGFIGAHGAMIGLHWALCGAHWVLLALAMSGERFCGLFCFAYCFVFLHVWAIIPAIRMMTRAGYKDYYGIVFYTKIGV